MIPQGMVNAAYLVAAVLFILSLGGLSHQRSARRGNWCGIAGMALALAATLLSGAVTGPGQFALIALLMAAGGALGCAVALRVPMTAMPQLVAILHSFVGLAAVLVGFATFLAGGGAQYSGVERTIHAVEIYLGVGIGAVTFTGSVAAFGKLQGIISSAPLTLPARHWLNAALGLACVWLGVEFATAAAPDALPPLLIMTALALLFGAHMVVAIGGADMPVVISMLNSYSGWAAAATGFVLANDLLIVTGALVGSSGAILSYIMCRAMNRRFLSVIAGGFGGGTGAAPAAVTAAGGDPAAEATAIDAAAVAALLGQAQSVLVVPGYGMAVARAQHPISAMTGRLRERGATVTFGIHPVAGRMPGHMNVLLAEAQVPYDIVREMEEVNAAMDDTDVALVVGANDIVNPSALDTPDSPIAGMPVIEVWRARRVIVLKRSLASGYAGVENPLFFRDNTRMFFGHAKTRLEEVLASLD
ncbi:MAG: NAD(P)(+) transhydrogenase (Re/Si-specific) subunit beta [Gammaproteobacteria bacterium]|nr:NAD(P)(+) transhydrogenase (Re/Si-specific) subunit beta [Gammaproteobacteria bacterium]